MRKLYAMFALLLVALVAAAGASSKPLARTFVVKLDAEQEVPRCAAASKRHHGVAHFKILDASTGTVAYKVISTDLPGNIVGSPGVHIHGPAPRGMTAPILQPLTLTGNEVGVVARGTFTNPALVAAALANPQLYYVNVHSTICPPGVIRGQFA